MSPVKILHLEDNSADADLLLATLKQEKLECVLQRVTNRAGYTAALAAGGFDLVLADYNLPSFDGLSALALARQHRPEVPFLFLSGFIGEEVALESLKNGATDYVFKHNMARLAPAIRRALQEAREHREREQAEAALREREATLGSFYDAAPFMMGLLEWRPDGLVLLSANAATGKFLGTTVEAIQGRTIADLGIPPDFVDRGTKALREALRSGRPVAFERVLKRGTESRNLAITVSALPSSPAHPPRFCYVAEDTTEKRQLEQQFFRAQRLESVSTLASGLAHDLNNVLGSIVMSLRLFRAKLTAPDDLQLLANLESSARRGADIIRQVLTFARGAEGARQRVRLPKLIHDLVVMLRDTFPRSIEVTARVPDHLWNVIGDSTQIYQVLMNLCVNARDAMPAGGRLVLSAENVEPAGPGLGRPPDARPGPFVILSVADTGEGIAPEILDKVFDPFFTTKEIGKGTGLGLSTALTIVKSHGGFITVSSQPGQGSEFRVHLPAQVAPVPAPYEAPPMELPRGHGQCILVAEDDATLCRVTRAALEEHGYRVFAARDGVEAMRLFQEHRDAIQLVVTDMVMPLLDGPSLIENLCRLAPGLPIIAVSGLLDTLPGFGPDGPPAMAFLDKPFTAESLLQAVQAALSAAPTPVK